MTAVAFGTYALVRRLKASGLSEDQAEAITGVLRDGCETDLALLTTKADLRETAAALRTDLREDISAVKADLRETEARLDAKIAGLSHQSIFRRSGNRFVAENAPKQRLRELRDCKAIVKCSRWTSSRPMSERMTVKLGTSVAAGIGIMIAAFRYLPPAGH